jgi:hypothetical protein
MNLWLSITMLCAATVTTGCLFPAAMSTMGAVGSDAPAVWNHWGDGQGQRYCRARYDDVVAAVLRAGDALDLALKEKRIDRNRAFIRFLDSENDRVDISVDRRSETMTAIKFDVGWFGPVAFGRLVDQQIVAELNEPGSALRSQGASN